MPGSAYAYLTFLNRIKWDQLHHVKINASKFHNARSIKLHSATGSVDTTDITSNEAEQQLLRLRSTGQVFTITNQKAQLLYPSKKTLTDSLSIPNPYEKLSQGHPFNRERFIMIIDVHSHAWLFPNHFSDTFRQQAQDVARAEKPLDLTVTFESYKEGAREVNKSIVFGGKAKHSGLWVDDTYVAEYVATHPGTLSAFFLLIQHRKTGKTNCVLDMRNWDSRVLNFYPCMQDST